MYDDHDDAEVEPDPLAITHAELADRRAADDAPNRSEDESAEAPVSDGGGESGAESHDDDEDVQEATQRA